MRFRINAMNKCFHFSLELLGRLLENPLENILGHICFKII